MQAWREKQKKVDAPVSAPLVPEPPAPQSTAPTLREQRDNMGRVAKSEPVPLSGESDPLNDDHPSLSFMHQGRSSSGAWNRPWVRISLLLVSLVLISGLLIQVSIHERDRIVATEPSAKRFLEPICEVMGCEIGPLRQIEAIVIDSSSFTKVRSDVYRLSFALKNSAQTQIATPAVELTLTDIQDQPVVRRVFTAAEFSKQTMVMEPGAELLATVPVSIKNSTGQEKISGYRLLSFYP